MTPDERLRRIYRLIREARIMSDGERTRIFREIAELSVDAPQPWRQTERLDVELLVANDLPRTIAMAREDGEMRERVLRLPEWHQPIHNGRASCPWCENFKDEGHEPWCARNVTLAVLAAALS